MRFAPDLGTLLVLLPNDGTRITADLTETAGSSSSLDSLRSLGMTAGTAAPLLSIHDFKDFGLGAEITIVHWGQTPLKEFLKESDPVF